jgi:putative membrane protein
MLNFIILKLQLHQIYIQFNTNMKLLLRIFITALLVTGISYLMKGVIVDEFTTALTVAIVLGLLNFFVKPILVLFTLPITFFTLGLFLLVINTIIIMLCDYFIDGFKISTFWTAMLFSIILSLSQSLVFQLTGETKK